MWYRIFGRASEMPSPAAILDLTVPGASFSGRFATDASGWYRAELLLDGVALHLERYLAEEEGIRAELNSWAAWLETRENVPQAAPLMERMIQTRQLFTLQSDEASPRAELLCRFLADITAGVYQIDERGIFAPDGMLLVPEEGA